MCLLGDQEVLQNELQQATKETGRKEPCKSLRKKNKKTRRWTQEMQEDVKKILKVGHQEDSSQKYREIQSKVGVGYGRHQIKGV